MEGAEKRAEVLPQTRLTCLNVTAHFRFDEIDLAKQALAAAAGSQVAIIYDQDGYFEPATAKLLVTLEKGDEETLYVRAPHTRPATL